MSERERFPSNRTVFFVEALDYEDGQVIGVFSTAGKAIECAKEVTRTPGILWVEVDVSTALVDGDRGECVFALVKRGKEWIVREEGRASERKTD